MRAGHCLFCAQEYSSSSVGWGGRCQVPCLGLAREVLSSWTAASLRFQAVWHHLPFPASYWVFVMSYWAVTCESTLLTQMKGFCFYYFEVLSWWREEHKSKSWLWILVISYSISPFLNFFKCLTVLPAPHLCIDVLCFSESLQGPLWHSSEANESLYKITFNALN